MEGFSIYFEAICSKYKLANIYLSLILFLQADIESCK